MKKLALTVAIVLGLSLTTFADPNGGGMFKRANDGENLGTRSNVPMLPGQHGSNEDWGDDDLPLGSGVALLAGLGAAYLVAKKRREE